PFCEELLIRYKDDPRIGHIGGNIQVPGLVPQGLSYDFCSVTHIWGWATWRRVWQNFDLNFPFWEQEKAQRASLFCNKWEEIYFSSFIPDTIYDRNGLNTWDALYYFSLRLQHQLSVYPTVNMVENIGIGDPNATHTKKRLRHIYNTEQMPFPLQHPRHIMRNARLDRKAVKRTFFSYKRLLRYILKLF
ncbi:MAG: hypothetical protein K2O01_01040, partial [Bacteroidales bacterium]|nr:hypothetical protein [Bacteroidales bacterium]